MSCCHCRGPVNSREMLLRSANGFGAVALAALMSEQADGAATPARSPLTPRAGHFAPKARSIIFLYMDGGPSQVDTFDPKPRLNKEHGEPIKMPHPPTQFIPHDSPPKVSGAAVTLNKHGESGTP